MELFLSSNVLSGDMGFGSCRLVMVIGREVLERRFLFLRGGH